MPSCDVVFYALFTSKPICVVFQIKNITQIIEKINEVALCTDCYIIEEFKDSDGSGDTIIIIRFINKTEEDAEKFIEKHLLMLM